MRVCTVVERPARGEAGAIWSTGWNIETELSYKWRNEQ